MKQSRSMIDYIEPLEIISRRDFISLSPFKADFNAHVNGKIRSFTYLIYYFLQIINESPLESKPALPALPLIYLYLALSSSYFPIYGPFMMTAFAGRLIPVLRVHVAHNINIIPSLNPLSKISLSSDVNPE